MTEKIKKDKKNDQIEEIKKELEECKSKSEEYLNNWKRERADFVNYKKDEMEKIGFLGKCVKEDLIFKILPILDNIYLAEAHIPKELKEHQWLEGFSQIQGQLVDFLKKEGIEQIDTLDKNFDPNLMEAVEEVHGSPTSTESIEIEAGMVIEEIQKGYTMQGKVIRPAKVKIAK